MLFKQACQQNLLDRFEMMKLAEFWASMTKRDEMPTSFDDIIFENGQFRATKTVHIKKKESLMYFSMLLAALLVLTNKRLVSIFMNHYISSINNTDVYRFLPKSRRKAFLLACGGLSGSGKSRVAREIAPFLTQPLGAVIIRDDIVRKQLAGVSFDAELDKSFYTPEKEKAVYKEMRRQAKQALLAGYPVILDALFYSPAERKKAKQLAQRLGLSFEGLWMEAPLQIRAKRVTTRKNNPSDIKSKKALTEQLAQDVGSVNWRYVLTNGTREETIAKVKRLLKKYL